MKVSEKGQVTIPKDLRDEFGIGVDSTTGRGRPMAERLRGRGVVNMSTDEIMSLTRGD